MSYKFIIEACIGIMCIGISILGVVGTLKFNTDNGCEPFTNFTKKI